MPEPAQYAEGGIVETRALVSRVNTTGQAEPVLRVTGCLHGHMDTDRDEQQ